MKYLYRRPPAVLERAKWSNADGKVVPLERPLSAEMDAWKIDITHSTDFEGWQYGSVFKYATFAQISA